MSNLSRLHTPRNPEILKELGYSEKAATAEAPDAAPPAETDLPEAASTKRRRVSAPTQDARTDKWTPKPIVEDTLTRKIRVSGHFTKQERADIRIAAAKMHLTGVDEFVRMAVLVAVRNCDQLEG
jgi:hypothetical protein